MTEEIESGQPERRSFLSFAILGIGAIFSAIIGIPIGAYVLDPRHRKGPQSAMKLVDGVKLDELVKDRPVQGVVRDTRMDGWTLYPNDVIGRVWVIKVNERVDADFASRQAVEDFNKNAAKKNAYLFVFTTICPHLGCSVNMNNAGDGFACPCHSATFNLDGKRANEGNPAQRGMDLLDWEVDVDDPEFKRIKVTYKKYKANEPMKIELGSDKEESPNV